MIPFKDYINGIFIGAVLVALYAFFQLFTGYGWATGPGLFKISDPVKSFWSYMMFAIVIFIVDMIYVHAKRKNESKKQDDGSKDGDE